jgi:hypothetical protein
VDEGLLAYSESSAFTRGRGADLRARRERLPDRLRQDFKPPQAGITTSITLLGGLVAVLTDTGTVELPRGIQPAWWSPVDEALAHEPRREMARRELAVQLHARIAELKRLGSEENLPWSARSEDDFWVFVSLWPQLREPGLILMDNGNLRAMWRNAAGEQVALEFRGYKQVYFVFFARRPEGPPMARSAGEDSIQRIGEKIAADNLTGLLRGEG